MSTQDKREFANYLPIARAALSVRFQATVAEGARVRASRLAICLMLSSLGLSTAVAQTVVPATYETASRAITGGRYAVPPDARGRLYLDAGESPRVAAAARLALKKRGFEFVEKPEDAAYVVSVRGALGFANERRFYYVPVEAYFKTSSDTLMAKAGTAPRTALSAWPSDEAWPVLGLTVNVLINIGHLSTAVNANPSADFDQQTAYRHAGAIGTAAVVHLNIRSAANAASKLPTGFVRGQAVAQGASLDQLESTIDFAHLIGSAADIAAQTLAEASP